ncbi:MAG TPA: FAD-dependent oxidoreductase [Solirubrobacterales bacterium]|nr:FAD-dependent oxidoreductase [Solirubrobacterales bacterium]
MENDLKIVIVGAGLTAAKATEELLDQDFGGEIVPLGDEDVRPYERPPLSKEFLRGESDPPFVHDEAFYERERIELRTGVAVSSIDPAGSTVSLDGGETIGFDRLLIATGAEPRHLDLPGSALEGIVTLRTLEDSKALGARLGDGLKVAVIGAGWIGSEVAASARQKGCEVTMIAPETVPLERVLGEELGAFYRDVHTDHGVRFLGETATTGFNGSERVESVSTDRHGDVPADLVVVGVGVSPRAGLAEAAGIATENGILVDASLETDLPGIFAAGDVANAWNPFYERRIRVEHWANARRQGAAAARSMLGQKVEFDEIPYFYSDQYDVGMEYVGFAAEWDEIVYRGDVAAREFIAFWLKDGRIAAGMNVNVWDVSETIRDLIRARAEIDPVRLADPETDLASMVPDG